jgi:putative transposase
VVNQLLNENQVIIMEDLNVSGMLKNHNLARSIQELSLYKFKILLEYKANWYGRYYTN